mgnify:FL=1
MTDEARRVAMGRPLDFNLSPKGVAVIGGTNSASELRAFIQKLEAIAALLPILQETDNASFT